MRNFQYRIRTLLKYKYLLTLLVQRDLKLKYRRSFLGYIWTILNPLLSMLVMVVVFSHVFSRDIENFPVYLICGNIMFSFMREATTLSMNSIIDNASLLKKVYVPKYIFTLSKVTSCLVNFVLSLGALAIVILLTRTKLTWHFILIVIPMLELYVFCVGLGLFLAQATVFFRDIRNIWGVVTLAWMYVTPIFYSIDMLSPKLRYWIPKINPMYIYITQMRQFILSGVGAWDPLIWRGAFVAVIMLVVGLVSFLKTKDRFILYI